MREVVPLWVCVLLVLATALNAAVFIIRTAGDGVARVDCAPVILEPAEKKRPRFDY